MFVIELEVFVNAPNLLFDTGKQFPALKHSHRKHTLDSNHIGLGTARNAGFPGCRPETVRPAIGIGGAVDGQFIGITRRYNVEKLPDQSAPQYRPCVIFIPGANQLALLGGRGRVVRKITRILYGNDIEGILLSLQFVDIGEHPFGENAHVAPFDSPVVAGIV